MGRRQDARTRKINRALIEDAIEQFMVGENRLDANETAVLARQLEHQLSRQIEIGYTPLKTLGFFPLNQEVHPGARTFRWEIWDEVGMAKIIANYADDLPQVDVVASEEFGAIKGIGDSYQYSTEDLRAAAMTGRSLPQRKRLAARRAFDRRVDDIAANGDAKAKLPGILTNANLPIITAADPDSGSDTKWNGGDKTNLEILEDLYELCDRPFLETHEHHSATTLLLPPTRLLFLERTPMSVDNTESILATFKKNSRSVREVAAWHKLETAGADGAPAAFAYERSAEVIEIVLPLPFTEREPQARNLAFVVNCEGKIGGVALYKPLATCRMDGI